MEITTADKINGVLMVFSEPKFYLQLALVALVLFGLGRARRTAHSIPSSKVGRLGLVLHWGALLIAVVLLGLAGLLLAEAKTNDTAMWVAGGLAAAAVIVWLIGKSLRYILTGPTAAPTPPTSPTRSTSVPSAGVSTPSRRPWG